MGKKIKTNTKKITGHWQLINSETPYVSIHIPAPSLSYSQVNMKKITGHWQLINSETPYVSIHIPAPSLSYIQVIQKVKLSNPIFKLINTLSNQDSFKGKKNKKAGHTTIHDQISRQNHTSHCCSSGCPWLTSGPSKI